MAIILTDSLKYCAEFSERVLVNKKNVREYEHHPEVIAAFCSRGMAKTILELNFPNLIVIQLFSAGYDGIDLDLIRQKGITLCNAANVYNIGMSEFVVYALLMSAKRYHRNIKNHHIRLLRNYHYITELFGKTVGIMGCGNIGSQIAQRLSAFDMKVIGYDTQTEDKPFFNHIYGPDEKKSFVPQCDYLVCCLPLMKSTERILDYTWFSLMKENITFINVARKQIIKDDDCLHFLKTHQDATAILDMLERIPNPITNPYRRLPNALVLPGITAASVESMERLHHLQLENLKRMKAQLNLLSVVV